MIVVSDAGPIRYLVFIDRADLLRDLYGRIVVPPAVVQELSQPQTPAKVRRWMASRPDWVDVRSPRARLVGPDGLGAGEIEAVSLAVETEGFLLCDDQEARRFARENSVALTGTLGVLIQAHAEGMDDIRDAVNRLSETNFRATPALLAQVVASAERRSPS